MGEIYLTQQDYSAGMHNLANSYENMLWMGCSVKLIIVEPLWDNKGLRSSLRTMKFVTCADMPFNGDEIKERENS